MILLIRISVEDYDKNGPVIAKRGWLQSFPNTEASKQKTEMNPQDIGLSKQGSKFGSNKNAVQEHQ